MPTTSQPPIDQQIASSIAAWRTQRLHAICTALRMARIELEADRAIVGNVAERAFVLELVLGLASVLTPKEETNNGHTTA